jgi:hypothetical protein
MAITNGTNVTALEKPAVGIDTGPGWATAINNSIDAVDGHDHSSNKGIRITPAAINISADLEYNQNSATQLKNVIFDSTVTASSTAYSLYQASGNLYWRDGSGTQIQMTITGTVNSGAGSITGMISTQAAASYSDSAKTFHFFTDGPSGDYGKMSHADLLLYKFTDNNSTDVDYVTIAANAGVSGASGTIYVPSENGTFLTTATSYAGAINIATSNSNNNIALKPNGTGFVMVGNAGATGKLTSNGAYDLILSTNSGTNSGTISITDAADGSISFIPNGTGEIVIGSGSASGKITTSGAHDLVLDTNAGSSSSSITITDAANGNIDITPNGSGEVNISKVDIDAGAIDGTAIGASSHTTGKFTTCDATTDFTIGGLVVTDGNIADTGTLAIVPVDGCTIALGTDAGDDFNVASGKLVVEGDGGNVGIGTATPAYDCEIVSTGNQVGNLVIRTTTGNGGFTGIAFSSNSSASREKAAIYFQETLGSAHHTGDIVFALNQSTGDATRVSTSDERLRITKDGNLSVTGTFTATTIDTGNGATEIYDMNQDLETGDAVTFAALTCATIDTGNGATEIYDMNQDLETGDSVQFAGLNLAGTAITSTAAELNLLDGSSVTNATVSKAVVLDSSGNIALPNAKGISFAATGQASSSSSELLDDYEEGTWSAVFSGTSPSAGSFSQDMDVCHYTKIGRMVWINMHGYIVALGDHTGNFTVTGLPYTAGTDVPSSFVMSGFPSASVGANWYGALLDPGLDTIIFRGGLYMDSAIAYSEIVTGRRLKLSGWYIADVPA